MIRTISKFYIGLATFVLLVFILYTGYNIYNSRNVNRKDAAALTKLVSRRLTDGLKSPAGLYTEEKKSLLQNWMKQDDRILSIIIYSHDTGVQMVYYREDSNLVISQSGDRIRKNTSLLEGFFQQEYTEDLSIPNGAGLEIKVSVYVIKPEAVFNPLINLILLCLFVLLVAIILLPFTKEEKEQADFNDRGESSATQVSGSSLEDWVNHQLGISREQNQDLTFAFLSSDSDDIMEVKRLLDQNNEFQRAGGRTYKVGKAVVAMLIPGMALDASVKTFNPVLKEIGSKGGFTSTAGRNIHGITLIEEAKAALRKARNENTTLYGFKIKG